MEQDNWVFKRQSGTRFIDNTVHVVKVRLTSKKGCVTFKEPRPVEESVSFTVWLDIGNPSFQSILQVTGNDVPGANVMWSVIFPASSLKRKLCELPSHSYPKTKQTTMRLRCGRVSIFSCQIVYHLKINMFIVSKFQSLF